MILPFIVPDLELNNRITRVLLLFKYLSYNKSGNLILSIDKIAVFDFFLQHVYILHSVLKSNGKKILFSLSQEDINSINREYPNTSGLYTYEDLKILLQILIVYGFISVGLNKNEEAMYFITKPGEDFISNASSEYTERLEELCQAITPLQSENLRTLMIFIKPFINGN